jgi:hypothetical protein
VVIAIRNYEVAPDFSAAEKRYLEQIVARTELLEFVGIPSRARIWRQSNWQTFSFRWA